MGTAATAPTATPPPGITDAARRLLPWLVAMAFFMESLDTTILNTAVPAIAQALNVVPLSMKSVLSSYTLSLAVFIPISGWVADRYGTRRVFASAIGLFTLGSLLCGLVSNIHLLVACRILQGCGGAMMVPVGRLTLVRTFAKSELVKVMTFVVIPALIGPMLGPFLGGLIVHYLHWRVIFFINIPIGFVGLYMVYKHLPDYREAATPPLDYIGLILFGSGIALLSYVLEVFGEHTLSTREIFGLMAISLLLLAGYGLHAVHAEHPLLKLVLLRIRTFRAAVGGGFITRIGIGGIPFLFPLLYQVGLGFSPVQSGLMLMPQAVAAMGLKLVVKSVLKRFGYRAILISNTAILGGIIMIFATIGADTPIWLIIAEALAYGFFASLQYSAMNTLVYADVEEEDVSGAGSIASTFQQLSISFGVASASLATALFIPDRFKSNPGQMIHGVHQAFLVLGAWTIISSVVFWDLRKGDGGSVAGHKSPIPAG